MTRLRLCLIAALCSAAAYAQNPPVTISAIYGGGGAANSLWLCDYVELHNRTTTPITVSGWSVQYAAAGGTTWQVTILNGVIPPCGYYLVRESCGVAGMPLPAVDATGTIPMSNASGKVALCNTPAALAGACPLGAANLVDFVGYGAANCWETNPASAPAPGLSVSASDQRLDQGCVDTNANQADFVRADPAPAPRNTQSQPYCCNIGACCVPPNNTCIETSPSHCASLSGTYYGPGSTCSAGLCVGVEACCFETACVDLPAAQCVQNGGQPQGPGTTCATINGCRRACCFPNGTCQDLPYISCQNQGGTPQGVNTACATTICPVTTGACCLPNGACIEVPPSQCNGLFQGLGSTCNPNPCRGACCLPNGVCNETSIIDCTAGQFLGAGSSCSPNPCVGVCCFRDGTCSLLPPFQCDNQGGFPGALFELCTTERCKGACCLPDGSCAPSVSMVQCDSVGGTFQGFGSSCATVVCPRIEACCFVTGCSDLPVAQCQASGGTPQGPGTTCAGVNFCRQACCLPNGACSDLFPIDCNAQNGTPQGTGTTCATTVCTQACCLVTSCSDLPPGQCLQLGGTPQGPGTTCAGVNFCRQACCLPNGACIDVPPGGCTAQGGTSQGPGSTCATTICAQACCYPSGACANLPPTNCISTGGTPQGPGTNCGSVHCPVTIACCLPNGICVQTAAAQCVASGGYIVGATCVGVQCVIDRCGSILVGDADCSGAVNNFDIDFFVQGVLVGSPPDPTIAPPGYIVIGGTQACWDRRRCWGDVNCDGVFNNFDIDAFVACILAPPPPGSGCPSCSPQACCLPGNCAVLFPAGCTLAGGLPQGPGSLCTTVICP